MADDSTITMFPSTFGIRLEWIPDIGWLSEFDPIDDLRFRRIGSQYPSERRGGDSSSRDSPAYRARISDYVLRPEVVLPRTRRRRSKSDLMVLQPKFRDLRRSTVVHERVCVR